MKVARKYIISGRVQGVGFRYFAERWAIQLGISGYVKNCSDGSVEVYAIGNITSLGELKKRLSEGPRSARVTSISEHEEPVDKQTTSFRIENDW